MTEREIAKNVACMNEMFPAFIEHYKKAALHGNLEAWSKAIKSVVDLLTHDSVPTGGISNSAGTKLSSGGGDGRGG